MIRHSTVIWRAIAVSASVAFLAYKLFLLPPFVQTSSDKLNANFLAMLQKIGAKNIAPQRQTGRADLQQVQFTLPTCTEPYLALQALTLEDLQALLDVASQGWHAKNVQVNYLGHHLGLIDRLGLKLTAVTEYVSYRFGASDAAPTAYLYLIIGPKNCNAATVLQWPEVWRNPN